MALEHRQLTGFVDQKQGMIEAVTLAIANVPMHERIQPHQSRQVKSTAAKESNAALKTSVWGASAAFLSASFRHVLDDTNV